MSQSTAIVIAGRLTLTQADTSIIGGDQRLQALTRSLGESLRRTPVASALGRIQTDQAHAAAIGQAQGIAVHHPLNPDLRQLARRWAERP